MASAFPGLCIELPPGVLDAGGVRVLRCLPLWFCTACAGGPAPAPAAGRPIPHVPLVAAWPAGTSFRTALAPSVPDELPWRAAKVWWREALRQTVAFELRDDAGSGLPVLELSIDPAAKAVAAIWRDGTQERPLAGGNFADGDLPAAIDTLAWSARLALGEACTAVLPVAAGTSAVPTVALAVDDAGALLRDGGFQAARRILLLARSRDGGSPYVLEGLATIALLSGDLEGAERTAREALGYEARLLPTTQHRLGRTLLLARASAADGAAVHDRELLTLAEVGQRERPHDPEPRLSQALAWNFLGEFARAKPVLGELANTLPDHPIVSYHLGWACLGSGDPGQAAEWFERAAVRLPAGWVLLPRAIALYESRQYEALQELLGRLQADAAIDDQGLTLDLLRMQAALALLRGDSAAARTQLTAILTWLLKNPLVLSQRVGEFAEQGALLVRLGAGAELLPLLTAIQQQHTGAEIADVCTFLAGMVEVRSRRERLPTAEATLARGGDSPWASLLTAYACELRGELADMQEALARASRLANSPMTKALLARGLHATGRVDEARNLLATLRGEMRAIHLRKPCKHPLLGPELAFAFLDP